MKTKTLLIAAAALAAGVISSEAQVYSQNIVGYVNVPLPLGYSAVSIPLSSSLGNALTNTMPNSGQLDGANIFLFTGTAFNKLTFDSSFATGFGDASDNNPAPTPVINPGTTFYINNNTGVVLTNVFVGNVAISSIPGTTTNTLPAGQTFVSSILPLGGGLTSSLQFSNTAGSLDGTLVLIPIISGGAVHGYTKVTFDSNFNTGFGDASDNNAVPEPVIPVGTGFIYNNNAGAGPISWKQTLNP